MTDQCAAIEVDKKSKKEDCQHSIGKPYCFKLCGYNVLKEFYRFKQEVEIYFKVTDTYSESNNVQVARLLDLLSSKAMDVVYSKLACQSVDKMLKTLEEHCASKKNVLMDHHNFFTRKQNEHEPIEKYFEDLKILVKSCSFNDNEDSLLRTQLVLGLYDAKLQKQIFKEDWPLTKILDICKAFERRFLTYNKTSHKILETPTNEKSKTSEIKNTSQTIEHINDNLEIVMSPNNITIEDIIQQICEIEKPEETEINDKTPGSNAESTPQKISDINKKHLNKRKKIRSHRSYHRLKEKLKRQKLLASLQLSNDYKILN